MIKSKLLIFLVLFVFISGLTAFQKPFLSDELPGSDSLRVNIPANFPKPVYNFQRNPVTGAGFMLGKTLFYDPVLSRDKSVSCASCHQAFAAFANLEVPVSKGVGDCLGKRNAPPLFNLAWQKEFMWDGRINNLQDVPTNALTNLCEMANTMDSVLQVLRSDCTYQSMFSQAFGSSGVTSGNILKALAQFCSMMISANSKYDKYIRKEPDGIFTASEQAGYSLFRKKCSNCHTEPLFTNGTYKNNGLDETSPDIGRDSLTHLTSDRGKFRVPSLRNVEITKPYMHDGRFSTLKQVLQHYHTGVKNHVNLDPELKKNGRLGISLDSLQQTQLIDFLKTLTDVDFINDRRFVNH